MSQALRIRESALSVVEQANTSANSSRRITKKAAWSVRDLAEVEEIDESLKEAHKRIEELQTA